MPNSLPKKLGDRPASNGDRIYSALWRIPDDIFHQALPELEAQVAEMYPDLTTIIEISSPVSISAATVASPSGLDLHVERCRTSPL
ncbi:MAG: hypothetical protein VKL39_21415 [Leptolyngbyaceae bacterium]|nr:hypothetical protein [Leptolyngbyaceae bacterium]